MNNKYNQIIRDIKRSLGTYLCYSDGKHTPYIIVGYLIDNNGRDIYLLLSLSCDIIIEDGNNNRNNNNIQSLLRDIFKDKPYYKIYIKSIFYSFSIIELNKYNREKNIWIHDE